ncbi:MAG: hypothetical protein Q9162_002551 [Coniocarpon cinnabarinum]
MSSDPIIEPDDPQIDTIKDAIVQNQWNQLAALDFSEEFVETVNVPHDLGFEDVQNTNWAAPFYFRRKDLDSPRGRLRLFYPKQGDAAAHFSEVPETFVGSQDPSHANWEAVCGRFPPRWGPGLYVCAAMKQLWIRD